MIVVDASVLAPALGDDGPDGRTARSRLAGQRLTAPELIDLEVVSVWRRHVRSGLLDAGRATQAVGFLASFPMARVSHRLLLARTWELRENHTVYDAAYLALAEALEAPLVTADETLRRGYSGPGEVELLR